MRRLRWRENGGKLVMSGRRSSRQKRTVDYRQFADGNSDEDDDFASSSVLPRKARTAERAPVRVKGSVEAGDTQRGKKEREGETLAKRPRQSRDERRFSKDTEKVLRESLDAPSLSPSPSPRDRDNGDHVETRHSSNPGKSGDADYQPPPPDQEEEKELEEEELASGSDSDFSDAGPPQKKKTPVTVREVTRKKRERKESVETKKQKSGKLNHSSNHSSVTSVKKAVPIYQALAPSLSNKTNTQTSKPSLGGGSPVRRMPNWTPPGRAVRGESARELHSVAATSGGTPLIRVGLSRKARIKPLHNSCTPQHT